MGKIGVIIRKILEGWANALEFLLTLLAMVVFGGVVLAVAFFPFYLVYLDEWVWAGISALVIWGVLFNISEIENS